MTRARDVMTKNPATVPVDCALVEAARLLERLAIHHLPVVDEDGVLAGMLYTRHVAGPLDGARAGEVMAREVIAASADDDLGALARLMVDRHDDVAVIVDERDAPVGIVSYVDLLRRLAIEAGRDPGDPLDRMDIDEFVPHPPILPD